MKKRFELNAGTGIALGIIAGAALAALVTALTADTGIWVWAIPLGAAIGVAIGASRQR
jgi:hypothetical protein